MPILAHPGHRDRKGTDNQTLDAASESSVFLQSIQNFRLVFDGRLRQVEYNDAGLYLRLEHSQVPRVPQGLDGLNCFVLSRLDIANQCAAH
jgi:hypothetical protein